MSRRTRMILYLTLGIASVSRGGELPRAVPEEVELNTEALGGSSRGSRSWSMRARSPAGSRWWRAGARWRT